MRYFCYLLLTENTFGKNAISRKLTFHLMYDPVLKIPVPLQDVAVWLIFISKKISVIIPEQSVVPKNWIIHTRSGLSLREIYHIKDHLCLAGRRTQNEKTLHADLILAGIAQLITVVLADKINCHKYIRVNRFIRRNVDNFCSITSLSFAITFFLP